MKNTSKSLLARMRDAVRAHDDGIARQPRAYCNCGERAQGRYETPRGELVDLCGFHLDVAQNLLGGMLTQVVTS